MKRGQNFHRSTGKRCHENWPIFPQTSPLLLDSVILPIFHRSTVIVYCQTPDLHRPLSLSTTLDVAHYLGENGDRRWVTTKALHLHSNYSPPTLSPELPIKACSVLKGFEPRPMTFLMDAIEKAEILEIEPVKTHINDSALYPLKMIRS
ncbi:Hypothetical predicted protein [Olea europaea subsp. europaea]|uniref:Uncharacterized protein n=1 Tax=Olea europaea subsp. europaea TaxID=158383 RepID=A0A8S0Q2W3_OLEEU|nr:Hypothetical predicted protein [Olea europaea subsp. europaea]